MRDIAHGGEPPNAHVGVSARLQSFATQALRREFVEQGAFLYLPDFLCAEITAQLHCGGDGYRFGDRNYLPGHKQGGSVSRHTIDRLAPFVGKLYRSEGCSNGWANWRANDWVSPSDDPHAYAFYFYPDPAITLAGTTTLLITPAAATRC